MPKFINQVLGKALNDFTTVYLNNILVYSKNKNKHIKHV